MSQRGCLPIRHVDADGEYQDNVDGNGLRCDGENAYAARCRPKGNHAHADDAHREYGRAHALFPHAYARVDVVRSEAARYLCPLNRPLSRTGAAGFHAIVAVTRWRRSTARLKNRLLSAPYRDGEAPIRTILGLCHTLPSPRRPLVP